MVSAVLNRMSGNYSNDLIQNSAVPDGYVYVFNSPQYFNGHIGHDGILLQVGDGQISIYSFHPYLNQGAYISKGSIAHFVHPEDASSFDMFVVSCLTPHPDIDHRSDDRGILLENGTVAWNERIRRVIRMGVNRTQLDSMRSFADSFAEHPHGFNFITYSCQHFVDDVLKAGGIEVRDRKFDLFMDLVPNSFFKRATDSTKGVLSFEKIDLEEYALRKF